MARKMVVLLIAFACVPRTCEAQEKFFIFPQFVDGAAADGSSYRSTVVIEPYLTFASSPITCSLRFVGLTVSFGGPPAGSFSVTVPGNGWLQMKTTAGQALRSGYLALTCSDYVFATVTFAYYSTVAKIGEATIFGVVPYFRFRLVADQTEGAKVGIAVANDSDLSKIYNITLSRSDGVIFGSSTITVGPRETLARFLDELVPSSSGQILGVEIRAPDSSDCAVVGLRYTGGVFTTVPAT